MFLKNFIDDMRRRALYSSKWFEYWESPIWNAQYFTLRASALLGDTIYLIPWSSWTNPGIGMFNIDTKTFSYVVDVGSGGVSAIGQENNIYIPAAQHYYRVLYIYDTISKTSTFVERTALNLTDRYVSGIYDGKIYILSNTEGLEIVNLETLEVHRKSLTQRPRSIATIYNGKIYSAYQISGNCSLEVIDLAGGTTNMNMITVSNITVPFFATNPEAMFIKNDKVYLFCRYGITIYDLIQQNTEDIELGYRFRQIICNDGDNIYITGNNSNIIETFNITTKECKVLTIPLTSGWTNIFKYNGDFYITSSTGGGARVAQIKGSKLS